MSKVVVVLKDEKAGGFNTPMFFQNKSDAVRNLQVAMKQSPQMMFAQFPADFTLWMVGEWSDEKGEFNILFEKEFIINLAALAPQKEVSNGNG